MYKQILSDRESHSFIPKAFESNKDVIDSICRFYEKISQSDESHSSSLLGRFRFLFTQLSEDQVELDKIYFNVDQLSDLSQNYLDIGIV